MYRCSQGPIKLGSVSKFRFMLGIQVYAANSSPKINVHGAKKVNFVKMVSRLRFCII
jgi:hypothetical protein